jgi:hypothetical protein
VSGHISSYAFNLNVFAIHGNIAENFFLKVLSVHSSEYPQMIENETPPWRLSVLAT